MGLLVRAKQQSLNAMLNVELLLRNQFVEHVPDSALPFKVKQLVYHQTTATLLEVCCEVVRWECKDLLLPYDLLVIQEMAQASTGFTPFELGDLGDCWMWPIKLGRKSPLHSAPCKPITCHPNPENSSQVTRCSYCSQMPPVNSWPTGRPPAQFLSG